MLELKLDQTTMFEHSQESTEIPHYKDLLEFINSRAQASEKGYSQPGKSITSFSFAACTTGKNEKHPLYALANKMVSLIKQIRLAPLKDYRMTSLRLHLQTCPSNRTLLILKPPTAKVTEKSFYVDDCRCIATTTPTKGDFLLRKWNSSTYPQSQLNNYCIRRHWASTRFGYQILLLGTESRLPVHP